MAYCDLEFGSSRYIALTVHPSRYTHVMEWAGLPPPTWQGVEPLQLM